MRPAYARRVKRSGLLAVALLAGMAGCARRAAPAGGADGQARDGQAVVVSVDNHTLAWGELNTLATNYYIEESRRIRIPPGREAEAMEAFRRRAASLFIYKTVMLDEARAHGMAVTETDRTNGLARLARILKQQQHGVTVERFFRESPFGEARARREFEEGLLLDVFIERVVRPTVTIGEAEIEAEAARWASERQTRRQMAEAIRAQLLAGESFARLAAEYSQCPSGKRSGGDLGQLTRGKSYPAFEAAAFGQPVGEIGPVVETPAGLHLIRVDAHHAARPATATEPAIPESVQASHILVRTRGVATRQALEAHLRQARLAEAVQACYERARGRRRIVNLLAESPAATRAGTASGSRQEGARDTRAADGF